MTEDAIIETEDELEEQDLEANFRNFLIPNARLILQIKPAGSTTFYEVWEGAEFFMDSEVVWGVVKSLEEFAALQVASRQERQERMDTGGFMPQAVVRANRKLLRQAKTRLTRLRELLGFKDSPFMHYPLRKKKV